VAQPLGAGEAWQDLYTRDISSHGAFVRTTRPLALGLRVEVSVSVPPGDSFLNAQGEVVRVEDCGMAIHFSKRASIAPAFMGGL